MRKYISSSIVLLLAALLPAALVQGHDDVIGTRFVAPDGRRRRRLRRQPSNPAARCNTR